MEGGHQCWCIPDPLSQFYTQQPEWTVVDTRLRLSVRVCVCASYQSCNCLWRTGRWSATGSGAPSSWGICWTPASPPQTGFAGRKGRREIHSMTLISNYGSMLSWGFEFNFQGFFFIISILFLFRASGNKNKDVSGETIHLIFGLSHTSKTWDCLLNLIRSSALHIPPKMTWQQRTMPAVFLGLKQQDSA